MSKERFKVVDQNIDAEKENAIVRGVEKNKAPSIFDKVRDVLLEHLEEEGLYDPRAGKINASEEEIAEILGEISAGAAIGGLEVLGIVSPEQESRYESMTSMGGVLRLYAEHDAVIDKVSRKKIGKRVDPDTSAKSEADYYRATHDPLSDALNREGIQDSLEARDENGDLLYKPLAYLYIDAREFKVLNTLYGELGGDMGIKIIGRALQNVARTNDLVGRRGGDEFCMIIRESRKSAQSVGKLLEEDTLRGITLRIEEELERLLRQLQEGDVDDLSLTVDRLDKHTGEVTKVTIDPKTIKVDTGAIQWMGDSPENYSESRLVAEDNMNKAKNINKGLAA